MQTRVVNIRDEACDVNIMRPSIFGNPYIIDVDGDREECIEKFRVQFLAMMCYNVEFWVAVETLRGKTLGCVCKPLPCHGDIYVAYFRTFPAPRMWKPRRIYAHFGTTP